MLISLMISLLVGLAIGTWIRLQLEAPVIYIGQLHELSGQRRTRRCDDCRQAQTRRAASARQRRRRHA